MAARKTTPKKVAARKQAAIRKSARSAAALEIAERDAMVRPPKIEIKHVRGKTLSLHELNIQQREQDRLHRDEIRDASVAAAKAVQKTLKTAGSVRVNGRGRKVHGPNTAPVMP